MVNFREKVKKFFLPSLGRNVFLVCLILISASFLFFPHPALAAFWDRIIGALTAIPFLIINIFAQVAVMLTALLCSIAGGLLQWVTGDVFVSLSYTNPSNPIIKLGLDVTRSFVNMGLVLAMIVIAFTTILRTKNYETQKLLFKLIVVALLINFSHVICGIIVDAANIMMNYFLAHTFGLQQLTNNISSAGTKLIPKIDVFLDTSKQIPIIAEAVVLIVFNLVSFFVLLMFAFIFLFRYIAIWILVILSPLAFVCYILPATKKIFEQWWNQLIQWSFVGVIAAFFIYLGEHILTGMLDTTSGQSFSDIIGSTPGILDTIMPYLVPLGFLIFGLVASLKSSAMGADVIISGFKGAGKTAMQKSWKATKKRVSEGAREKTPKEVKNFTAALARKDLRFKLGTNQKNKWLRGIGAAINVAGNTGISPFRWALRGIGEAGLHLKEADTKNIGDMIKKTKDQSTERIASIIKTTGSWQQKIAMMAGAARHGKIEGLKKKGITATDFKEGAKEALKRGFKDPYEEIMAALPTMSGEVKEAIKNNPKLQKEAGLEVTDEDKEKGITNSVEKVMVKFIKKPSNIENMDRSQLEDPKVIATFIKHLDPRFIAKAGEKFGKEFTKPFQKMINGIEIEKPGWLKKNKPALHKYLESSGAARNLGMGIPSEKERKENKEEYKEEYESNRLIIDAIIKSGREPSKETTEKISPQIKIIPDIIPRENTQEETTKTTELERKSTANVIRKKSEKKKPSGTEP